MRFDHDAGTNKQYIYGYFCKCGIPTRLGRGEVVVPETQVECRICGYKGRVILGDLEMPEN